MSEPLQEVAISNPILGSLKVSSANVNTLITLLGFIMTCLIAWVIWHHEVAAKDSEKQIAVVLRETNKEFVQALRESNSLVKEAIQQMTQEQRRANEIGREQTCLLTLPPDRRTNAGDFCKRLSRERDR